MTLPDPETTTDIYLAAILAVLRQIEDLLEEPQPVQEGDEVDLVEPKNTR
jgi:hypothetical protein